MERDELPRANEEAFAFRGQRHAAGRPHEQRGPEPALQLADVATYGLLGNEQASRRTREVEFLGDRDEIADRSEIEVGFREASVYIHAPLMLVERDQVLDVGCSRREALGTAKPHHKGPSNV